HRYTHTHTTSPTHTPTHVYPPQKTPNTKTCRRRLSCPSLTKTDGSLHLVPRRLKAALCSWLRWRKDSPGWENAEEKLTATSACMCVCVCPVSPPKCTCMLL